MIELSKKVENRFRIDLKKLNRHTDRDVLKVVHYSKDGHIEMTNSHVGVRLKNVHDGEEKFEHGDKPESYPNMDHLFDQSENKQVIENIPVKEFEDIFKDFKKLKPEVIHLNFSPYGIFTEVVTSGTPNEDTKSELKINLDIKKSYQVTLKYDYLLIIVQFIRLIGLETFDLYYPDTIRPLSFVNENLELIVAPIRNSNNQVYDGVKELEKKAKG